MTRSNGVIRPADATVFVGMLATLHTLLDWDEPDILDQLLRRLRNDLVKLGLSESDSKDDQLAAIDAMITRLRRDALGKEAA
ncbi:hypothetical protein [Compostimonas suwonensis]|uniref:Uncharacterized protein n=1 Tax=Compostimonas suwonensis TaxID=1048394 RepID=A0A2M9C3S8_9MICO|nr:hypothetical protein [Compostimonas suwonensis]PJJ65162.1 hypothetical protein CLV54_0191 [Compostimonas suwonensis]